MYGNMGKANAGSTLRALGTIMFFAGDLHALDVLIAFFGNVLPSV